MPIERRLRSRLAYGDAGIVPLPEATAVARSSRSTSAPRSPSAMPANCIGPMLGSSMTFMPVSGPAIRRTLTDGSRAAPRCWLAARAGGQYRSRPRGLGRGPSGGRGHNQCRPGGHRGMGAEEAGERSVATLRPGAGLADWALLAGSSILVLLGVTYAAAIVGF